MRIRNTFPAHRLIDWAGEHGRAHAASLALFKAFFTRRENVSDPAPLADVAARVGLGREAAWGVLERGGRAEIVREKGK